jgi:hypothetical protein
VSQRRVKYDDAVTQVRSASSETPAPERANKVGIFVIIGGTVAVFLINAAPIWVRAAFAVAWFAVVVAVTAIVVRAIKARRGS